MAIYCWYNWGKQIIKLWNKTVTQETEGKKGRVWKRSEYTIRERGSKESMGRTQSLDVIPEGVSRSSLTRLIAVYLQSICNHLDIHVHNDFGSEKHIPPVLLWARALKPQSSEQEVKIMSGSTRKRSEMTAHRIAKAAVSMKKRSNISY